ncbi:MAG: exopolysaccharide biosynthesis protein [Balneolales bacterium]
MNDSVDSTHHMEQEITKLDQLLDRMKNAVSDKDQISLKSIIDVVGARSFGPLLLIAGLITLAPLLGDIPGVPTIMGLFVMLISVQMIYRHGNFWLPKWLLNRSVSTEKFQKGIGWLRRPAKFLDRLSYPRLTFFFQGGIYIILITCALIAALMPLMEFVPFSANIAGIAFTTFGLSLITKDGLLASLALLFTVSTIGLGIYYIL